jgi:hypothetical protein
MQAPGSIVRPKKTATRICSEPVRDWRHRLDTNTLMGLNTGQLQDICQHLKCRYSGVKSALVGYIVAAVTALETTAPLVAVAVDGVDVIGQQAPLSLFPLVSAGVRRIGILCPVVVDAGNCSFDMHKLPIANLIVEFSKSPALNILKFGIIKEPFMRILNTSPPALLRLLEFLHCYFLNLLQLYNSVVSQHSHVDNIEEAKIGSIIRAYSTSQSLFKREQGPRFVKQNPIIIDALGENGAASGIILFRQLEKLVFDYSFDWIGNYFGLNMSAHLVEPSSSIAATFSLPALEKFYLLTSNVLGRSLTKFRCPHVSSEIAATFLAYNFYDPTTEGRRLANACSELHTGMLNRQNIKYIKRSCPLESTSSSESASTEARSGDTPAEVVRFPKKELAAFVEYFSLVFYSIFTVDFALLYNSRNPPIMVETFILNSCSVREKFLQCVAANTRSVDDWEVNHHGLFCHLVRKLLFSWLKDFYHNTFQAALGAKHGDTTIRILTCVSESSTNKRKIAELQVKVNSLMATEPAVEDHSVDDNRCSEVSASGSSEQDDSGGFIEDFDCDAWDAYDEHYCVDRDNSLIDD